MNLQKQQFQNNNMQINPHKKQQKQELEDISAISNQNATYLNQEKSEIQFSEFNQKTFENKPSDSSVLQSFEFAANKGELQIAFERARKQRDIEEQQRI